MKGWPPPKIDIDRVFTCNAFLTALLKDCSCFFPYITGTSEIDLSSPLNYGTPSSRLGVGTPRTPGAAMTPIRPRPDVRSERKMRTVNLADGSSDPVSYSGFTMQR